MMTRCWYGVKPQQLCNENNHFLGERNEIVKAIGGFLHHPHGLAITRGQVEDGNLSFDRIEHRHERLSAEAKRRDYKHDTTLVRYWGVLQYLEEYFTVDVDEDRNKTDLIRRCEHCRENLVGENQ